MLDYNKITNSIKTGNFSEIESAIQTVSGNVQELEGKGADTTLMKSLLSVSKAMKSNLETINQPSSDQTTEITPGEQSDFIYRTYLDRINKAIPHLSNLDKLARLKHDIKLEQIYITLLNGKYEEQSTTRTELECKIDNNEAILSTKTETTPTKSNTFRNNNDPPTLTDDEGISVLTRIINTDITRQQKIHLLSLQSDLMLKMVYLQQETELLDSMLEQQDALLRGLSDWSDYLDQQTNEYAEMYEKMDALISTQRRKSSFTVRDIQSLEKWTYGSHVMFWILIASGLLMVIVYNFTSIKKIANSVDKNLNQLRNTT